MALKQACAATQPSSDADDVRCRARTTSPAAPSRAPPTSPGRPPAEPARWSGPTARRPAGWRPPRRARRRRSPARARRPCARRRRPRAARAAAPGSGVKKPIHTARLASTSSADPARARTGVAGSARPRRQHGSVMLPAGFWAAIRSRSQWYDAFGVRARVSKSTWTRPNRLVKPSAHSKLSSKRPARSSRGRRRPSSIGRAAPRRCGRPGSRSGPGRAPCRPGVASAYAQPFSVT